LARSETAELLARLVEIDSVNPVLVPGGAGEGEIARFVAGWCEAAGLEVEVQDAAPGRPNVVARASGSGGGRSLLLNAHMDTVGVAGMERPFEPRVEDGRLYGRGAYDMKGGLAAIMVAGARALELGLRGDVVVTAVADEETASIGTEAVLRSVRADAAIVSEASEMRVHVAHKGFVGFEIETVGRAAHGSRPDLGVDAIARMGGVLVGVSELEARLSAGDAHPLLGTGSVHASLIEGGQEFSSYPARCLLSGERRTIPGETVGLVEEELRALLGDVDGSWRVVLARDPLETSPAEPIVELVARLAGGGEPGGAPWWTEAALLSAAGIPTVVFGPGGDGAHAVEEWVDLGDVERCAELYLAAAADFCA
jgi:acetylornithine deacetylase